MKCKAVGCENEGNIVRCVIDIEDEETVDEIPLCDFHIMAVKYSMDVQFDRNEE